MTAQPDGRDKRGAGLEKPGGSENCFFGLFSRKRQRSNIVGKKRQSVMNHNQIGIPLGKVHIIIDICVALVGLNCVVLVGLNWLAPMIYSVGKNIASKRDNSCPLREPTDKNLDLGTVKQTNAWLRKRCGEAALKRSEGYSSSKKLRGRKGGKAPKSYSKETESIVQLSKTITKKELCKANSPTIEERALVLANQSLAYTNGVTVFRVIPTLPQSDVTSEILTRIAHEFLPIIQERGYRVRSVSEYYFEHGSGKGVDTDGLDFELGGFNRSAQPGDKIQGHDMNNTLGYNGVCCSGSTRGLVRVKPDHTIHLRLRHPDNLNWFYPYEQVVKTMAHELAHCVHRNHGDAFQELMKDIMEDYMKAKHESQ